MIRHFLKVASGNILKKGKLSALNIIGRSLDIASFMFIGLYVFQETSYESEHDRYLSKQAG